MNSDGIIRTVKTAVLGISAYYHDSAATLVIDGEVIAAAQEERFSRIKGDASFPHQAVNYCLNEAKITINDLTEIVFYEDTLLKFARLLKNYHLTAPRGFEQYLVSLPKWLTTSLWLNNKIRSELGAKKPVVFTKHHLSHAASAFYPSPFEKAAILTVDGVGEWATMSWGVGEGNQVKLKQEMKFPNSLGLLYSTFTAYTGFKINSGEYKLMGLAPYGQPKYTDLIKEKLIKIFDDGSIELNQEYFSYTVNLQMCNKKFHQLFNMPPRKPEGKVTQKVMDIAASVQEVLNEVMLKLAVYIHKQTKMENLVMAGGVALNAVAVAHLKKHSPFKNIWVQPAAGDAGGSLGAALLSYYDLTGAKRVVKWETGMKGCLFGPAIANDDENDSQLLSSYGGVFKLMEENKLAAKISDLIAAGKVVGLARGRMEFGPRALGSRSILADARNQQMQTKLNLKIKFRESFRPFAPMVLEEDAKAYFEMGSDKQSPYMSATYSVVSKRRKKQNQKLQGLELLKQVRSDIPAVTHLDYSARLQTVDKLRQAFVYQVMQNFKKKTGCSVIINTSFNVRGEPIVGDALDAYRCFMNTDMDYAVIGNRLFEKSAQDQDLFKKMTKKEKRRVVLD